MRTLAFLVLFVPLARAESVEDLVLKGSKAADGKDWKAAAEQFELAAKRHDADRALAARAHYERALCLAKLENKEEASTEFAIVCEDFADQPEWVSRSLAGRMDVEISETRTDDTVKAMLGMVRLTVDFRESRPLDVLLFMKEISNVAFLAEEEACATFLRERISLRLKDHRMIDVVDLVARLADVEWCIDKGKVVFMDPSERCDRKRAELEADDIEVEILKRGVERAKVSLSVEGENAVGLVEYLRITTQLPLVASRELQQGEWRWKGRNVDWKDAPISDALAKVGLSYRLVNGVVLVEPKP